MKPSNKAFDVGLLSFIARQDQKVKLCEQDNISEASLNESSSNIVKIKSSQVSQYMGVNQVLVYKGRKDRIFFVPAYLRVRVIRVNKINYLEAAAEIETQMKISLMIKQFPEEVQDKIMAEGRIYVNKQDGCLLKDVQDYQVRESKHKKNKSGWVAELKIKKTLLINIESNPFLAPFELIKLTTFVELSGVKLSSNEQMARSYWTRLSLEQQGIYSNSQIRFNFMDAHPLLQFSFNQLRNLGSFDLAESMLDIQFNCEPYDQTLKQEAEEVPFLLLDKLMSLEDDRKKKEMENQSSVPMAFEYARVLLPLYRFPGTSIVSIFLPFYLLSILLLGVFFQNNDMTNRSASIATLQIAFIAFFPTIRSNLPETPKIVFAEILIYAQTICTVICFLTSLYHNQDLTYKFHWQNDIPFLICLAITVLNISIVFMLLVIHKCVWEPRYNQLPEGSDQFAKQTCLNTDDWQNPQCQRQFKPFIEYGLVRPAFSLPLNPKNERMKKSVLSVKQSRRQSQRNRTQKVSDVQDTCE